MSCVTMKELLESGVHFGHQTKRWNPKMKKYIFAKRNGIYIIDLQKTIKLVNDAYNFIRDKVSSGSKVLFVGTKRMARESIISETERCGMFYVTERWLGGMMTNFKTIKFNIKRLKELEQMEENPEEGYKGKTKKEILGLKREREKLNVLLSGIKNMETLPDIIFIVDTKKERIAVLEASKLNIPIVAILDTNSDPDNITYPIPGNDDAIKAIKLFSKIVSDAVLDGKGMLEKRIIEEKTETPTIENKKDEVRIIEEEKNLVKRERMSHKV